LNTLLAAIALAATTSSAIVPARAQAVRESRYTLLDVLVFGAFLPVDSSTYLPGVRTLLQQHIKRSDAYRPRPRPGNAKTPEMKMVYDARERYERKLFAIAAAPGVERLAQQYVDELRPCYEWEGLHGCPEAEAKFAEQYLKKNPASPFSEFLTLLIAHRWLCEAEGYETEQQPQDAARARRAASPPLATALEAKSLLIRTAAKELRDRNGCIGKP
jgi:hypothetical protein